MSISVDYKPRQQVHYKEVVVPYLKEKFGFKNIMQIPRIEKICINKGIGAAVSNKKEIDEALNDISNITGQKAVVTLSKKDISNFKLRKGYPIGVKVTLRKQYMYEFLDRLISIVLPRERDFKGINPKSFDGRGNYNLGIREQIVFPEINMGSAIKIGGLDITFVTTADRDEVALELLKKFGMPFKEN
ncbi:MAG: 50S ribosomal protein L5 [Solitalea-like symbiont of Acarus siro]